MVATRPSRTSGNNDILGCIPHIRQCRSGDVTAETCRDTDEAYPLNAATRSTAMHTLPPFSARASPKQVATPSDSRNSQRRRCRSHRGAIAGGGADMTGANRPPTQQTTRDLRCQSAPTPAQAARLGLQAAVVASRACAYCALDSPAAQDSRQPSPKPAGPSQVRSGHIRRDTARSIHPGRHRHRRPPPPRRGTSLSDQLRHRHDHTERRVCLHPLRRPRPVSVVP